MLSGANRNASRLSFARNFTAFDKNLIEFHLYFCEHTPVERKLNVLFILIFPCLAFTVSVSLRPLVDLAILQTEDSVS